MSGAPITATTARLGYPADARLLLVNADDFGMYPAVNKAVVRAFAEGIVRSTSLMMPCPGASQAVDLLREHPDLPFGVHLSIVRDVEPFRWGPMAPKASVRSLLDEDGNLYTLQRMPTLLERAKLSELEVEFRTQIDAALATGLRPTHLDWHCLYDGGRADIFVLTKALAIEYGFALRVWAQRFIDELQSQGLPTSDHGCLDSFELDVNTKQATYAEMLRSLPPGLTEWAVHPGGDGADARATDPDGWRVRQTDFDFLVSPQAHQIIEEEGIALVSFAPLQRVWQERA